MKNTTDRTPAHELLGFSLKEWLRFDLDARVPMLAGLFAGFKYTPHHPTVPFQPHKHFPKGLVRSTSHATNCSTLTGATLMGLYPQLDWAKKHYGMLQIFEGQPGNAPILAAQEVGAANPVDTLRPGRWHLIQGWRGGRHQRSGHAFLVRPYTDNPRIVLRLHAGPAWGAELAPVLWLDIEKRYALAMFIGELS